MLPDKFLVQLADLGVRVLMAEHEIPALGDGSARHVNRPQRAGFGVDCIVDTVDGDQRAQGSQTAFRIASAQHSQDEIVLRPGQVAVGAGTP